jgi:hypothetical protein
LIAGLDDLLYAVKAPHVIDVELMLVFVTVFVLFL